MKKQKGITIVSLVVTIIVLIILAVVSINALLGEDGIITIAKRAKENVELSQIDEQTELNELYKQLEAEGEGTGSISYDTIAKLLEFKKIIAQAITNKGIETSHTDSAEKMAENIEKIQNNQSAIIKTIEELKGGDFVTERTTIKDNNGNLVKIPEGFKIAEDSGLNVTEGIVIEDNDIIAGIGNNRRKSICMDSSRKWNKEE